MDGHNRISVIWPFGEQACGTILVALFLCFGLASPSCGVECERSPDCDDGYYCTAENVCVALIRPDVLEFGTLEDTVAEVDGDQDSPMLDGTDEEALVDGELGDGSGGDVTDGTDDSPDSDTD